MLALWSTVTWAFTYMYMGQKMRAKDETIRFLDYYIEEDQVELNRLRRYIENTEKVYGHVMDDYTEYLLTDIGKDQTYMNLLHEHTRDLENHRRMMDDYTEYYLTDKGLEIL
jgi:hypothetical protein